MQTHPHFSTEAVVATGPSVVAPVAEVCPIVAAAKARVKALKKIRKHESRRLFFSWCSCLHALGFSF
jgi:hypothetical protein